MGATLAGEISMEMPLHVTQPISPGNPISPGSIPVETWHPGLSSGPPCGSAAVSRPHSPVNVAAAGRTDLYPRGSCALGLLQGWVAEHEDSQANLASCCCWWPRMDAQRKPQCCHLKQGPWWAHGAAGTWAHAPRGTCDSQNAAAVLPQSHGEPEGHHCTRCSLGLAHSQGDSGPRATAGANYRSLTWLDVGSGGSRAMLAARGPLKTQLKSLSRCGISTPRGVKPGLCMGTPGWP